MVEARDLLLRSPLLGGVPASTVSALLAGSETRRLDPQEFLLHTGAKNDTLYIIMSGAVSVHVPGAAHPYLHLGPGECVGELSLLDDQPASADVTAEAPTVVLAVDRDQLWWLIESSAEVARNLFRILAGRVRHDDAMLGEARHRQEQLEHIATVDTLTGLRNRRWFDEMFPRQFERAARADHPVSLLMIDIDHFKTLNDTYGHQVGDAALHHVAQLLASAVRPQDLLARYGGEEFVVLLPEGDVQTAGTIAERLRQTVATARHDSGAPALPPVTISIGVASRQPGDTLDALLARADQALYRAKDTGRDRWCT